VNLKDGSGCQDGYLVSSIMGNWYRNDPEAAFQWFNTQDDEAIRKHGMEALINNVVQTEGVKGLERIWDDLDDEQRRALGKSYTFQNKDVEGLLKWMDE